MYRTERKKQTNKCPQHNLPAAMVTALRWTSSHTGTEKPRVAPRPLAAALTYRGRGRQAFESLLQLYEGRAGHQELCIPACMLPATISNNVPGTDLSLGADTALNAIVEVRREEGDPAPGFCCSAFKMTKETKGERVDLDDGWFYHFCP